MKKNILALAMTTAFAAPAAFADVEIGPFAIYGTLNSAVEVISVDKVNAATTSLADSQTRLADQSSKLGFKAKYDLGNGMLALGQIESRVYLGNNGNATDDKAEIGSRNTFIGLSSTTGGTLRLGRYDNAYKLSLKAMVPTLYGNLNDASNDYGDKQILNRLGARQGDLVAYESPNWSGISANLSYNLGKDSTNSISGGAANNTAKNTVATDLMPQLAIGLGYKLDALTIGFGYTSVSTASWLLSGSSAAKATNNLGSQKLSAAQFGGEYKFGNFTLGAVVERTSSSQSGTTVAAAFDQQQNVYGLTGGYKTGPWEYQVRYAKASDVEGTTTTDTGAQQLGLVMAYQIHKNLTAIGSFTKVSNQKNASFTSLSGFALDKGNSMNQIALGLAVSF